MNKPFLSLFLLFVLAGFLILSFALDHRPDPNLNASSRIAYAAGPEALFTDSVVFSAPEAALQETEIPPVSVPETIPSESIDSSPILNAPEKVPAFTPGNAEIPYMQWKGVTRLCQQDARWAHQEYSGSTIGSGGCGLVALSRALTYATGTELTPMDIIDMEAPDGRCYRYISTQGTDSTLFPDWAAQFGVEVRTMQNCNQVRYEMERRKAVAIAKLYDGASFDNGHYVLIAEFKDDSCTVLDSTLEGIMKYPDGIQTQKSVTNFCSHYILFYPVDTEVPSEKELLKQGKGLSHLPRFYDETVQKLDLINNGA